MRNFLKYSLGVLSAAVVVGSLNKYNNTKNDNQLEKKRILLLGDGFVARGFLSEIDTSRYHITQVYRDRFINPQDIIYNLCRKKWVDNPLHLRDFLLPMINDTIQGNVTNIKQTNPHEIELMFDNNVSKKISYDYTVIGLGAQKSLAQWSGEIKELINLKNKKVGIIGMGPTGIELAALLNRDGNSITLMEALPREKILGFVSSQSKNYILTGLERRNITTIYETFYNPNTYYFDKLIMCVGMRPNSLAGGFSVDKNLRVIENNRIYIGGDCANTPYPKTAQLAYEQGKYIAKQINGSEHRYFNYFVVGTKSIVDDNYYYNVYNGGTTLELWDSNVLIDGHPYLPDGVYSKYVIYFYSTFFI